jgi:hypothetical protein
MWTTKKKNKMLLAGMFGTVLALGSWLGGCASFKIDEGSIVEETIALKSVDLASLVAEYVRTWQPGGLGFITGPSEPGMEEIVSIANEWGYTEDLSSPISISITGVKENDGLPRYPQAKVSKFTATDRAGATREGVKIETLVEYPPVYVVSEKTEGAAVMGTRNLAIFLTRNEADAYADRIRSNASEGISINVKSYNMPKSLTCTLFKPL